MNGFSRETVPAGYTMTSVDYVSANVRLCPKAAAGLVIHSAAGIDPLRPFESMTEADEIRKDRERLREKYRGLFDEISSILFVADPIGINFETNTDEYEAEVGTILPRLNNCDSVGDVRRVVHEEFARWFSPHDAGPDSHYQKVAEDIWQAWQQAAITNSQLS